MSERKAISHARAALSVPPMSDHIGQQARTEADDWLGELGRQVERYASSDVTVTVYGETGTGKDRLARALHARGKRAGGPFVVVDCGAMVATLAESELFGHERGSFTGAVSSYAGAFERASGGTLFLDELGELPLELQPRLLRVLEQRQVQRVGGTQARIIDVRVIAATNRNLRHEVAEGRFRADLYYRVGAALVEVPPLRTRLDQLPSLVQHLLLDLGHADVTVLPEVYEVLKARPWLGNVRELKNALSCAVAFAEHGVLGAPQLQFAPELAADPLERLALAGVSLTKLERTAIAQTLRLCGGNRARTAEKLGIAVSTLYEKLRRYNL
jgi:two-component system, NtrC family, response regulator AtoC